MAVVYVLDWRYRRVEDRRDLEDRLGVLVLCEATDSNEGAEVAAQALKRRLDATGRSVLLAAAPGLPERARIAEEIASERFGSPIPSTAPSEVAHGVGTPVSTWAPIDVTSPPVPTQLSSRGLLTPNLSLLSFYTGRRP